MSESPHRRGQGPDSKPDRICPHAPRGEGSEHQGLVSKCLSELFPGPASPKGTPSPQGEETETQTDHRPRDASPTSSQVRRAGCASAVDRVGLGRERRARRWARGWRGQCRSGHTAVLPWGPLHGPLPGDKPPPKAQDRAGGPEGPLAVDVGEGSAHPSQGS